MTLPPLATDEPSFGSVSATAPGATVFEVVVPLVGFTVRPSFVSTVVASAGDRPAIEFGMVTREPGPRPKYQPVIPAAATSTAITRKMASPRPRRFCETRASAEVESETSAARGPRGAMIAVSASEPLGAAGRAKATVSPVAAFAAAFARAVGMSSVR